ncbi:MAG: putative nucleic-acid-binding Zn-ribbon protein [Natronomonas sp.]|jgi:predicted nucleic-acid-binding Zn-ribbon protein
MSAESMTQCLECGYEAQQGSEEWGTVEHPPLGELTQCPKCGSTKTRGR